MRRGLVGITIAIAALLATPAGAAAGGGCGPGDEYCFGPQATITKGPAAKTTKQRATFRFTANRPRARFRCALDRGPFNPCSSPKTYKRLKPGKHVFRVQAVLHGGAAGPVASHRWKVR